MSSRSRFFAPAGSLSSAMALIKSPLPSGRGLGRGETVAPRALARAIRTALSAPLLPVSALIAGVTPVTLHADELSVRDYDIPAGSLESALNRFGREAGILLSYPADLTAGRNSLGLRGRYTVPQALMQLLAGSGLGAQPQSGGGYTLQHLLADAAVTLKAVKVEAAGSLFDVPPETHGFKADFQESATKTPLSIRETPQSISVITRESMDARQARDLTTALELSASVVPLGSSGVFGGHGRVPGDSFVLRGQALNQNRDIRNDGFSVNTYSNATDLVLFERVEVVKGPSSVLYGQSSLSGFINRVRKKPLAEQSLGVVAQAGSYDTYRAELDATGRLSEGQGIDGRFIGLFEDAGAFVDGVKSQRQLIAPSASFEFGENTRLLLQGFYQDDEYTQHVGVPLRGDGDELEAIGIPRSRFYGDPGGDSDGRILDLGLQLDHQLSDNWLVALRLGRNDNRDHRVLDNYGFGLYEGGASYVYSSVFDYDANNYSGEIRLDGRFEAFGKTHQFLAGVERRDTETVYAGDFTYLGRIGNIYEDDFADFNSGIGAEPNTIDRTTNTVDQGFYTQLVLSITERTRLVTGARYDLARQTNDYLNANGRTNVRLNKDAWTYRLGVTQDLTDNITAFALYAQSFVPVTALAADGSILEPETGEGFELGLKTEWFDQRLGATFSAFRQEREDVPLSMTRAECLAGGAGLTSCSRSAGLQWTDGVELELAGSPVDGLTLGVALSWLDGEHAERDDPLFGTQPNGTVRRQSNFYVNSELQSGPLHGLGMGATLISLGDRFLSNDTFVKGYERVDLNFSYTAITRWDFGLQVRNLFDETYLESVSWRGSENYFGSPRAALFRAEYTFDL